MALSAYEVICVTCLSRTAVVGLFMPQLWDRQVRVDAGQRRYLKKLNLIPRNSGLLKKVVSINVFSYPETLSATKYKTHFFLS